MYTGGDGAFAAEHLERMGAAEYRGSFPLAEVTDLIEDRVDLLARWRAEQAWGEQQS